MWARDSMVRMSGTTGEYFRRTLKKPVQQGRSSELSLVLLFTFHGFRERCERNLEIRLGGVTEACVLVLCRRGRG